MGLNGEMTDSPFNFWSSNGEGVQAWIKVAFKSTVQVSTLEVKNRENPGERAKKILVETDDGSAIPFELPNTATVKVLELPEPIQTRSVKVTITEVYGTINNGLALKVWGIACMDMKPISYREQETKLSLGCDTTLTNNEKIAKMQFVTGDEFLVKCN